MGLSVNENWNVFFYEFPANPCIFTHPASVINRNNNISIFVNISFNKSVFNILKCLELVAIGKFNHPPFVAFVIFKQEIFLRAFEVGSVYTKHLYLIYAEIVKYGKTG